MDLEARRRTSQRSFQRLFGPEELGGGILAIRTPRSPERSLLNSVVYEDPAAVVDLWEQLDRRYDQAGVRAWTVWVHAEDRDLAAALAERGHVLDAAPESMGCLLEEADLAGPDVGEPLPLAEAVAINEAAYGLPAGEFDRIAELDAEALPCIGLPDRAVVVMHEHDGDAYAWFVATHPEARGKGLATGLMKQALRAARGRGCTTATLEATKAGRPVYERLGYRPHGPAEMWERRKP